MAVKFTRYSRAPELALNQTATASVINCEARNKIDLGIEQLHDELVACFVQGFSQALSVFNTDQLDAGEFCAEGLDCGSDVVHIVRVVNERIKSHLLQRVK